MKLKRMLSMLLALAMLFAPARAAAPFEVQNDLTQMSPIMVYGYVFSMLETPEEYYGQSFRMRGTYGEFTDDYTGKTYRFIVIADAQACCAQGLEFVLTGDNPEYPELYSEIELVGFYTNYEEEGLEYVHIEAISMTVL